MKAYVCDDGTMMLIPETDKDEKFLADLAKAKQPPRITAQIAQETYQRVRQKPHLSHVTIALQEMTL